MSERAQNASEIEQRPLNIPSTAASHSLRIKTQTPPGVRESGLPFAYAITYLVDIVETVRKHFIVMCFTLAGHLSCPCRTNLLAWGSQCYDTIFVFRDTTQLCTLPYLTATPHHVLHPIHTGIKDQIYYLRQLSVTFHFSHSDCRCSAFSPGTSCAFRDHCFPCHDPSLVCR